jgi:ABC-type transport system substrate-binding protein
VGRPHLEAARRAAAGFHGTLRLLVQDQPRMRQAGQLIQQSLAPLGITVDVRAVWAPWEVAKASRDFDFLVNSWYMDYLDPYDVLNVVIDAKGSRDYWGSSSPDLFDDPAWLARIRRTGDIGGAARPGAYAALDAALVRGPAPYAPLVFMTSSSLTGPRLGCVRFAGVTGLPDLVALCADR